MVSPHWHLDKCIKAWLTGMLHHALTGNASEYDGVAHAVASDAVFTVNIAGHFARGKEAGNRLTVRTDDFRIRRDHQTAHGRMHVEVDPGSPEGRFSQRYAAHARAFPPSALAFRLKT